MTEVTEASLLKTMRFFADLQSSGHAIFSFSVEAITFPNCAKRIERFHLALLKWQLKYCHLTDFSPKNMYRSDRTITSVSDRNDRSDSFVIR